MNNEYSLWDNPPIIERYVMDDIVLNNCARDMGFKGVHELKKYFLRLAIHEQDMFIADLHSQRWEPVLMYILDLDVHNEIIN